jgi:transaldolase
VLEKEGIHWQFNEVPMAVDKLAEGIRKFSEDGRKLEQFVQSL